MYSINKQQINKKTNIKQNRFADIIKFGGLIFHVNDLARIWKISERNTLLVTLKRYVDNGLLYRLYRGLYALKPIDNLDPLLVGAVAINSYSYLSCETVLVKHGVIFQGLNYFTFISDKSKRLTIAPYNYYYRQLKKDFLYNDLGVNKNNIFNEASLERAVADILYFNPDYYFDNPAPINWEQVREIQKNVYQII